MKQNRQSGFTLVEISIVLVIIGLLLGGVLKGQEIINNAKIKNAVNEFNGVTAAIYSYRDRYGALPGDDPEAATRWSGATAGDGNGQVRHYWWYQNRTTSGWEQGHFWHHLRLSGLVSGQTEGSSATASPNNAFGGYTGVGYYRAYGWPSGPLKICMGGVTGKNAEILDRQLDDGKPLTGDFRAGTHPYNAGTETNYDQETTYWLCRRA